MITVVSVAGAPAAEQTATCSRQHPHLGQDNQTISPDGRWIAGNVVDLREMRTSQLCVIRSTGGAGQHVIVASAWDDGVAPADTGPGDLPGGEIRGQIEHRGY